MKEIYPELIEYIFEYYSEYMTNNEKKAYNHYLVNKKFGNRENLHPKLIELKEKNLINDLEILNLLKGGIDDFRKNVAIRIFNENKVNLKLNLCPKCSKVARTPEAKQCRFCFYSWRE